MLINTTADIFIKGSIFRETQTEQTGSSLQTSETLTGCNRSYDLHVINTESHSEQQETQQRGLWEGKPRWRQFRATEARLQGN